MIENLQMKQATVEDIDFVIEAIIESEKSGTDVISSCNIFGISEDEFKEILKEALPQNVEGYDYYLSGFLIAESNGEYAGASGSWLEGVNGTPSGILKATILFPYLERTKIKQICKNTQIIKGLTLPREAGTLQLEHGYVREKFRRKGVFVNMVTENIKRNLDKYSFTKAQVILFKDNYKSYYGNLKIGCEVIEERKVDNPEILKFFPYNTKVLMEFNEEKTLSLSKYPYQQMVENEFAFSVAC